MVVFPASPPAVDFGEPILPAFAAKTTWLLWVAACPFGSVVVPFGAVAGQIWAVEGPLWAVGGRFRAVVKPQMDISDAFLASECVRNRRSSPLATVSRGIPYQHNTAV